MTNHAAPATVRKIGRTTGLCDCSGPAAGPHFQIANVYRLPNGDTKVLPTFHGNTVGLREAIAAGK